MMISKMIDFVRVQCDEISNWEAGNSTRIAEGSSTALWSGPFYLLHRLQLMTIRLHEPAYQITFSVENTGEVYGGDVSLVQSRAFATY
jgi:beta-glucosidase